jgi:flagellar basal-body rod protein FlgC
VAQVSFLRALNISGSALTAQRLRLDIAAENISNLDTTRTESGGPYRRKVVQFQAVNDGNFRTALGRAVERNLNFNINRNIDRRIVDSRITERRADSYTAALLRSRGTEGGVIVSDIIEDETPFKTIWDPTHPDADEFGYVLLPNVELIKEVVDAMSASRSYEANVTALNAIKLMASKALEVGR